MLSALALLFAVLASEVARLGHSPQAAHSGQSPNSEGTHQTRAETTANRATEMARASVSTPPNAEKTPEDREEDVFAALATLPERLESGESSGQKELEQLRSLFSENPGATLGRISSTLEGVARERAMAEVFAVWAAEAPRDALAWLARHDTMPGLEQAVSASLAALAEQTGAEAAAWLENNPDFSSRDNLEILISNWGDANPDQALDWVMRNLTPAMRDALRVQLLGSLRTEKAMTAILLDGPDDTSDFELAESGRNISQVDGSFALKLAEQIRDPQLRDSVKAELRGGASALNVSPSN